MKPSIVCVCVLFFVPSGSDAAPPGSPPDTVPAQSQEKPDPLRFYQGTWQVTGAMSQVGGRIDYHFSGNRLTVSYYSAEREKDGARNPVRLVSQTDYRVAVSKRGNYLKLTPLPEQEVSKEIIYRVKYSDGNLRLYDYEPDRQSERDYEIYTWQLSRVTEKK